MLSGVGERRFKLDQMPVNVRLRQGVNACSYLPNKQAALKCLYLASMTLDPTGRCRQQSTQPVQKPALNVFDIVFGGTSARDASNNRGRSYTETRQTSY